MPPAAGDAPPPSDGQLTVRRLAIDPSERFASRRTRLEKGTSHAVRSPAALDALAVIALAQFMVIMDTSIIGVALPEIQTDLG